MILVLFASSYSQERSLPIRIQYQLIKKLLSFDRNLKNRSGPLIVLGIVYRKEIPFSMEAKDELDKAVLDAEPQDIEGIPVHTAAIEFRNAADFSRDLTQRGVNIVYITPIRGVNVKAIVNICEAKRIPTFAGISAFVDLGVAVGFRKAGGKSEIIVNFRAARAQGFDLSSRFLNLVKIFGAIDLERK
jgi:hypothetical protein